LCVRALWNAGWLEGSARHLLFHVFFWSHSSKPKSVLLGSCAAWHGADCVDGWILGISRLLQLTGQSRLTGPQIPAITVQPLNTVLYSPAMYEHFCTISPFTDTVCHNVAFYKHCSVQQRFPNCGPRTIGGPRVLPLWSS
jgi:hypothetical protein